VLDEIAIERNLVGEAITDAQRATALGRGGIEHLEDPGRDEAR
jgi:hypothetical protein